MVVKLLKSDKKNQRIGEMLKHKLLHDPSIFLDPIVNILKNFVPSKQKRKTLLALIRIFFN